MVDTTLHDIHLGSNPAAVTDAYPRAAVAVAQAQLEAEVGAR